jgi:hypothetical protein
MLQLMNGAALPITTVSRPRAVWIIWIATLGILVISPIIPIAYFGYRDRLTAEFLQGPDRLGVFWWANLGVLTILGVMSGWTLFQMRTSAVRWFGASLCYAAVVGACLVAISGLKAGLTPSHWLRSMGTEIVEALIFAYSLRLRSEGKLRGRMPEAGRLRIPPPLVLAGVAAASISAGGRVAVIGASLILLNTYSHGTTIQAQQAMNYSIAMAGSGLLLALSGIALWKRKPAARELNAVGAMLVGLLWGINPLTTLGALCTSAVCLTRRSVNAYYLGLNYDDPAAGEARSPRALKIFYWILAGTTLLGLIWFTSRT